MNPDPHHVSPLVLPPEPATRPDCAEVVRRYAWRPERLQHATAARLLVDGTEAFPAMLEAIESAAQTVDLETYILRADQIGHRFQQALMRAAGRGLRVRLLYDFIGSLALTRSPQFVRQMIEAGVAVSVYHPLILTRPSWAVNRRDHRKILVVDRQLSFTGGLNIGDEYSGAQDGGGGWRDTHLRLDGPEVAERFEQLFNYGWGHATAFGESTSPARVIRAGVRRQLQRRPWRALRRRSLAAARSDGPCRPDDVPVEIIGNREFRSRHAIRLSYLHAFNAASRYILIENGYFIPDRELRLALRRAVERGVLVAVVVAGESDVALAAHAGRHTFPELLRSGVRLFAWPQLMLHAKTAVIDDAWALVGSYNIDHRSLVHQLEDVAVVLDPDLAARLRDQTLSDFAQCHEITRQDVESRTLWRKVLYYLAYRLRKWL